MALRAQHRSVAHGDHVMQIGLASVCPFDALLTGRGTDILALVAETSRALADIEVAGLAKVIPPGIGIVVGGGFIQNQLLAVDATAIGPHAVHASSTIASGRFAVAPVHERLGIGKSRRVLERETDFGINGVIRNSASAPKARAGKYVAWAVVGEHVRLLDRTIDCIGRHCIRLRLRRSANDTQHLEESNSDLIGVTARHFAQPCSPVGAFDRHDIGHAVAYEGVPRVIFQKHAADAGELIETMYRPSDHASGLVDFVQEGRAADVDVDRIGKAYL